MKNKNTFLKIYKNLRVLVTGTTGFKGAWLAFWLKNIGANVTGFSLKPEKDAILFKSLKLNKKIDQYYGDITKFNQLNEVIKKVKPDIIFHLAAQSIVSKSYEEPLNTINTNVIGSANILESYRLNNIPNLVYITSDKCYLNLDKKKNYIESDILGGLDNYSSSKASAEIIFSSYYHSYLENNNFLKVASARAGNVIGGGDMKADRIIPDIIKSIIKKNNIVLRNPAATRPWQHVLEPLSGYLLIGSKLLNKKLKKGIIPSWNFGPHPKNCKSVSYITKLALQRWGDLNLKIRKEKRKKYHESSFLSLNIKKSKKELNWQPRLNIEDTIKFTVEWYKKFFKGDQIEKFTYEQIKFFLNK